MTLDQITTFFGWFSVLGIAYLTLSTIALFAMQSFALRIHGALFRLDEKDLKRAYFNWLANCKLATAFLALGPYVALRLV